MIKDGIQVSFNYSLTSDGEEIENNKGKEPMTYTHGGGQILPALEEQLTGLNVGDTKEVALAAADAYGETNPEAVQEVPVEKIPEGARQVGAVLTSNDFPGPIRVTEVGDNTVVLDFNHPLAGKDLVFDIEIVAVDDQSAA